METQKIVNLLNGSDNENSKFATKKWYVIDSESKGNYSKDDPIKFLTKSLESSLCDYSDAYILVTGNITATPNNAATQVVFKNCAPFKDCRTEINDTFVDYANFINITMPMYNLIEYSDNYSDTSGNLWQFKRDEIEENADLTVDNLSSFKYKSNIIGNLTIAETKNNVKTVVPLKHLSNFWRSLETSLINCEVKLSLGWNENCILSTGGQNPIFLITDAKRYVPVVTLLAEDNAKLSKLLSRGFKRSVYWNKYKVIPNKFVEIAANNEEKTIRELPDSTYQVVKILFVLAYNNTADNNQVTIDSFTRYFLSRVKIENYNIEIDGRKFYDQSINDSVKENNEIRKIPIGQGDDYTTSCLLDVAYFEKNCRLIAVDLSKQKLIQQINKQQQPIQE